MELTVCFPNSKVGNHLTSGSLKDVLFCKNVRLKILDVVLQTYVGQRFNVDSRCGIKSEPFDDFEARHRSANYNRIFFGTKSSVRRNHFEKFRKVKGQRVHHYTEGRKCDKEIHPSQIREGFQIILDKIVSQELIGNDRNKKKILKALDNFLRTAKSEQFTLQTLVEKMNISSMTWLKSVKAEQTKSILIAKFIKWLFHYIILLIYREFHVTYIKEERVFISNQDWGKQKKEFIKKMNQNKTLLPISQFFYGNQVHKILFLIPKKEGLRCIVRQKYIGEERQKLGQVLCILKHLYYTNLKYTNSDLSKRYIEIVKENNLSDEETFIISADICDAFGSIKLAKLFDIINIMFKKLSNTLKLQCLNTRDSKKYKFVQANSPNEYWNSKNIVTIQKCDILSMIEEVIYNTKVSCNNKIYNFCKGVPQGLMLSAVLCDIYYAHMYKENFVDFESAGYLCTYVDDSIYITKDETYANRYLCKIKHGIPQYNCWFKQSKLNTNLMIQDNIDSKNKRVIEHLGWKIDPCSLEVQPKYHSPRYTISFVSLDILTLRSKLWNLNALKLNSLILCKEINSENRIIKNIEIIANQQAKRCFALMSCLSTKNHGMLMKIIRKTNFRIIERIEILTNWDENEKKKNKRKLQLIIWRSFYYVFIKKNYFFLDVIKKLKKFMKKYSINKN